MVGSSAELSFQKHDANTTRISDVRSCCFTSSSSSSSSPCRALGARLPCSVLGSPWPKCAASAPSWSMVILELGAFGRWIGLFCKYFSSFFLEFSRRAQDLLCYTWVLYKAEVWFYKDAFEDNLSRGFHFDGHRVLTAPFRDKNLLNKSKKKRYSRTCLLLIYNTHGRSSDVDLSGFLLSSSPPRVSLWVMTICQSVRNGARKPV